MRRESRSGILAVDKGKGVTSFQVVAHVRRLLRAPKVGHGGTLDPDATGVLPILIGEATKLTPFLAEHEKEYVAVVRLGITTDTQDLSGKTIATAPVPRLTQDEISEACSRFVGTIMQVPSMFSALHRGGRRLYELAREGIEVPREPREVTVRSIALESVSLPSFTIRVTCGKGTYVRSLCADVGEALGCGAALESLVRTRVGPFSIESAIPWEEIRAGLAAEILWERLLPMDLALGHWPAVTLGDLDAGAFLHGRSITLNAECEIRDAECSPFVRVYGHGNRLLAVGRIIAAERRLKPERILCGDLQRSRILPA